MKPDLLHGHLDLLLLAVLRDGPLHGYALISELSRRSDQAFLIPEGSAYPALKRLEQRGLVSSAWSDEGRRRRTYSLTAAGHQALRTSTQRWQLFSGQLNRVLGVTA